MRTKNKNTVKQKNKTKTKQKTISQKKNKVHFTRLRFSVCFCVFFFLSRVTWWLGSANMSKNRWKNEKKNRKTTQSHGSWFVFNVFFFPFLLFILCSSTVFFAGLLAFFGASQRTWIKMVILSWTFPSTCRCSVPRAAVVISGGKFGAERRWSVLLERLDALTILAYWWVLDGYFNPWVFWYQCDYLAKKLIGCQRLSLSLILDNFSNTNQKVIKIDISNIDRRSNNIDKNIFLQGI